MDWIKQESGNEEAQGLVVSYLVGKDAMCGANVFGDFSDGILTTTLYRGRAVEDARRACEVHNSFYSYLDSASNHSNGGDSSLKAKTKAGGR